MHACMHACMMGHHACTATCARRCCCPNQGCQGFKGLGFCDFGVIKTMHGHVRTQVLSRPGRLCFWKHLINEMSTLMRCVPPYGVP